jgi:hypothetical protein
LSLPSKRGEAGMGVVGAVGNGVGMPSSICQKPAGSGRVAL